ncbi:hypothetical protein MKW98_008447 [Papaver atlanticum]|uniref:Uncharacterized protein n=1 Tax=Papaver atlanticum TaxID=357466 RepID=A0AAD4SIK5_9MAGN|nr:hypothetical protein MKW98_008447 [Papaver atlanticum]
MSTYVGTSQIYGKQTEQLNPEVADIAMLMQQHEAFRVAIIETLKEGRVHTDYSKLVKADDNRKDKS